MYLFGVPTDAPEPLGSEFVSGRTSVEQVVDLRNSFRYLGVPINDIIIDISYVLGDNETMINSLSFPHAKLHKIHNILSYHYVRSMVASGFIAMYHIPSSANLTDILTKHWGAQSIWNLVQPVLNWMGNTADLYEDYDSMCLNHFFVKFLDEEETDSVYLESIPSYDGE